MNTWMLSYLLTDLIGTRSKEKGEVRNEIWASDLGGIMLDRYLDMKGIPYSDLPDGRGLANFFLGEQIETGLKNMLENLGIAYTDNERKVYFEKDYLGVVAKPDLIVEVPSWDAVRDRIAENAKKADLLEEKYKEREMSKIRREFEIVKKFRTKFPDGLKKTIFEIKSANTRSFKARKEEGASLNHQLQLLTYLKAYEIDEGHILYINKEYGNFLEFIVKRDDRELNKVWDTDVSKISYYIKNDIKPALVFDKGDWRFKYSKYFTMLYKNLYERENK